MLFSSTVFLFLFLPVVLALYFGLGRRTWNVVLLVASLVFYAWGEPVMVALMLVSIAGNYVFGWWVDRSRANGRGRGVTALAVGLNLGLLVVFKYADWLWGSLGGLLAQAGILETAPLPLGGILFPSGVLHDRLLTADDHIRLPIGISFFTFQALSYLIDVYRREEEVQKNPLDFGLYIALFPQLIAGPIVRYRDVARQVVQRSVSLAQFASGVRRFVIGLGKKVLIANVCGRVSDGIFGANPGEITPAVAWLGTVSYALQAYFDFSGYSDMAIGLGRMFGFEFRENFVHPYVSRSMTEIWRRWHISLSSWFRDYLYIPLGGNRISPARTYLNLLVVFVLCGVWHGAEWGFVVFGLYQGAFLVLERVGFGRRLERWPAVLQHVYLLTVWLVGLAIFRCEKLSLAGT
jgi:alginate O-acetyltransferase complex protein AlgI